MMNSFTIVLYQLIQFFVMLVCGYGVAYKRIVSKSFLNGLASLMMKLLIPVLIFSNAMNGTTWRMVVSSAEILWLTAGLYVSLIIVMAVLARVLRLRGNHSRIVQATLIFGNAGFIGIPLILAAFPGHGGIYVTLMSMVDQFFLWTYGIYLTTPQDKALALSWKNFINPALVAVVSAIVCIAIGITLPKPVEGALLTIGHAATPLALLYLGGLLYFSRWQVAAKSAKLYIGMAVKLLLFPLAFYAVASRLCDDLAAVRAMTLIAALPTMTVIAMFAEKHDNERDFTLGTVLIMTVLSLVTLTIVSYLIF